MGEVKFEFQENFTGTGYFIKNCKKSAAMEDFFSSIAAFADQNYFADENFRGFRNDSHISFQKD